MMETILSHQKTERNGFDVVVIDSVVKEYNGNEEQRAAMKILNSSEKKWNYSIVKFLTSGHTYSLSIQVGRKTGEIWISSHFLTKDDGGRLVPFTFWMRSFNNTREVIEKMKENARMVNMQLNPSDLVAIEKCLNYYPKLKLAIGLVALVAIVTIIVLL